MDTSPPQPSQRDIIRRIDYPKLDMQQLLELYERANTALLSRYERVLTLLSLDLGTSAEPLVQATGAETSALAERVRALIDEHMKHHGGRLYEISPARIDMCFATVQDGLDAAIAMAESIVAYNYEAKREDLVVPRFGMHQGAVLTDGDRVVGPAADATVEIAQAADTNLLWMSQTAVQQTSTLVRANCTAVTDMDIISEGKSLSLFWMPLRATETVPESVIIENTGETIRLPRQDIISFGRLDTLPDGTPANEVCLTLPDRDAQLMISRWHFELRRAPQGGYVVRVISNQGTEVDGQLVERGAEAPVQAETVVRLARKVNLRFKCRAGSGSTRVAATYQP